MLYILLGSPLFGGYTVWEAVLASPEELRLAASFYDLDETLPEAQLRSLIIELLGAPPEAPEHADSIEIIHADMMRTLPGNRILLTGNVQLQVRSDTDETLLKADLVLLDRVHSYVYAAGSLDTSTQLPSAAQWFTAGQVLYSSSQNKGSAVEGVLSLQREEGEDFFLTGTQMIFQGEQDIRITDGMLSTRIDDPYFSIRSRRIHIMDSGDIGLRGALLYLGRVPIFYTPYLFYPSRTFFFHPVIGFDSSRGFFSQNTLYLSGVPEQQDQDDHILQFVLDQGGRVSDQRDWYSLTYRIGEPPVSKRYRRIMTDVYGGTADAPSEIFVGYDLFEPTWHRFRNISLSAGFSAGSKRHGFSTVPIYDDFGGFANLSLSYRHDNLTINLSLPYMTSRSFKADFLNRHEHFSLQHLLDAHAPWPDTHREPTSLRWKLDISYSYRNRSSSLIEQFTLRSLSAELDWRLEDREGIRVFTPHTATAPSVSYRMSGTLYSRAFSPYKPEGYSGEIENPFKTVQEKPDALQLDLRDDVDLPSQLQKVRPAQDDSLRVGYTLDHAASLSTPVEADPLDGMRISSRLNHNVTGNAVLFGNRFGVKTDLQTRLNYYDQPFGVTQPRDIASTYLSINHKLEASLKQIGLSYRLDTALYYDRFLAENEDDRQRSTFAWNSDQITRHELFHDFTLKQKYLGAEHDTRLTLQLPPLDISAAFRLTSKWDRLNMQTEVWWDISEQEISEFNSQIGYRIGSFGEAQFTFDAADQLWEGEGLLELRGLGLTLTQSLLTGTTQPYHLIGPYQAELSGEGGYIRVRGDWIDQGDTYGVSDIQLRYLLKPSELRLWKGRIALSAAMTSELRVDRVNPYFSGMYFDVSLGVTIEELLTLKFSSRSYHRNPEKYFNAPGELLPDLIDSFRFYDEKARINTPFKIDAYQAAAVYHMPDWNLNASLEGRVELDEDHWQIVNRLHVYLQWNHVPELRVDQRSEF